MTKIIGAGISGLLAGLVIPNSKIYEAREEYKNNHQAILRCRSNYLSKITGIPFEERTVHKGIWVGDREVPLSLKVAHLYSKKVSGVISERSITNIDPVVRYIPPEDFVDRLVELNKDKITWDFSWTGNKDGTPTISTIPMYKIPDDTDLEFRFEKIYVSKYEIPRCDSYCTMYYPDPGTNVYRASLNKNLLIIESVDKISDIDYNCVIKSLGLEGVLPKILVSNHEQPFGKITPIPESKRKDFILKQTIESNIYSLGRLATWRPKLLLDDVLEDIFVIRRLISSGAYDKFTYQQGEK
ncbi:MAG: hypothetical protein GY861_24320 [bacterium]|nr:hypothetical protein [bacterium]